MFPPHASSQPKPPGEQVHPQSPQLAEQPRPSGAYPGMVPCCQGPSRGRTPRAWAKSRLPSQQSEPLWSAVLSAVTTPVSGSLGAKRSRWGRSQARQGHGISCTSNCAPCSPGEPGPGQGPQHKGLTASGATENSTGSWHCRPGQDAHAPGPALTPPAPLPQESATILPVSAQQKACAHQRCSEAPRPLPPLLKGHLPGTLQGETERLPLLEGTEQCGWHCGAAGQAAGMPPSHVRKAAVPAAPLPTQLMLLGKAAADSPCAWAPATHVGDTDGVQAPGSHLVQPQLL